VVVGLDGLELEIEETLGVQRGFFWFLFWFGSGGEWDCGTTEVEVSGETCETCAA